VLEKYLQRNAFKAALIQERPKDQLGLIVVIPASDEDSLIPSVESLLKCENTVCDCEIIVVFNASIEAEDEIMKRNINAADQLKEFTKSRISNHLKVHILCFNDLPSKHAGVGLARKIGMDEAVRRFQEIDNEKGIIVCFDADTKCEPEYLRTIEQEFKRTPNTKAATIHFEHPISGNEYSNEVYENIVWYELHLRYYKNGLAYAKLPCAFHTIGSSMAVRANAYAAQGGMNRRKAGEDFYFLQKFMSIGGLFNILSTKTTPSPRPSHRVPFGTGKAIQQSLECQKDLRFSYAFDVFENLKQMFNSVSKWYISKPSNVELLVDFIGQETFDQQLMKLRKLSKNEKDFKRRFFVWMNAFKVLKFVHYLRDHHFPNAQLLIEVPKLLTSMGHKVDSEDDSKRLLAQMRLLDKNEINSHNVDAK